MSLPDTALQTPGSVPAYFEAIKGAQAPERFSAEFLEGLDFKNTNDRLLIGVLKDLKFITPEGQPTERYFEYLDKSISAKVLAAAIREAYSDLFTVAKEAHKLKVSEVENKLRTLYKGKKTDLVIKRIARTFSALVNIADFSDPNEHLSAPRVTGNDDVPNEGNESGPGAPVDTGDTKNIHRPSRSNSLSGIQSLQYHINIVLPDSRDPAVFDAIFRSLKQHLP